MTVIHKAIVLWDNGLVDKSSYLPSVWVSNTPPTTHVGWKPTLHPLDVRILETTWDLELWIRQPIGTLLKSRKIKKRITTCALTKIWVPNWRICSIYFFFQHGQKSKRVKKDNPSLKVSHKQRQKLHLLKFLHFTTYLIYIIFQHLYLNHRYTKRKSDDVMSSARVVSCGLFL